MAKYFAKEMDMVFIAGHQGASGTRFYYNATASLSSSYPTFDNGFQIYLGVDSWAALLVRNPGNGSYDMSFDFYKTPQTANAVDVYAMPASVVTNLITDERGVEFFLSNATVSTATYMGESTSFGGAIKTAMDNGTAVKLGSVKDMTETGETPTGAKTTAELKDNKLTFANGEDMIIVFKTTEGDATDANKDRQLIYSISMTKAAPDGGEQPGGEQPGGEQPGGEQPGGEQPDGPAQTGEPALVMLMSFVALISLAAVCVVAKKRAA
jgi:hypothetical protein